MFVAMKLVLRSIGVLAAISVILTAIFIIRFGARGLHALAATGTFGVITVLGWLVTFVAGPIAAVQLIRVRNSGRRAALALFGSIFAYYVTGLFVYRQPDAPRTPIVWFCILLSVVIGVLLSSPARRTCIGVAALAELST